MLGDFEIIHHTIDASSITIYPISDVHFGAQECMEKDWEKFRKKVEKEKNSYIILGGDLLNNALKSSVSNVYEEKIRPRDQKKIMTEMLKPLKDKILCAVPGNHERRSGKDADDDPIYDIMCDLDKENLYRENGAFVKIKVKDMTYILFVGHGSGGGVLTGGVVNKEERFGYALDGCDALIFGHSHKVFQTQRDKIKVDPFNNVVSFKPFKIVSMSPWLAYGGYALRALLPPGSRAQQTLILNGSKKEIIATIN